jgi:signal transduction histidine kinase
VRVTKSNGHIALRITDEAGEIRMVVHDGGPGMDEQRRAKLFDPFFRGAQAPGTESVLSLSLVKRFMELHGGSVTVDSELGKGTQIICIFPSPAKAG